MQPQPLERGSVVAKLLLSLLCVWLATAQLACASLGELDFDNKRSAELYRRPHPPKARIPGVASTRHRYASTTAPMRLTASDGTGLALRRLQIEGRIEEPVSMIELHLTFENPHDQQLDAQFEILLPRGAEVSRFALDVNGRFVESEVVERAQAWQVYDAHKLARRDPAIFQRERGRRFSGRIFPITPRERKQIILSYSVVRPSEGPLARRAIAVMRVKALMASLQAEAAPETAQAMKRELVELSREHRILNDYTAMLTLESEQEYARFGIERSEAGDRGLSFAANGDAGPVAVNVEAVATIPVGEGRAFGTVGDTSRDFSAVVDISPTASRDSAGISLAGTTDAESFYQVDGSNVRDLRGPSRPQQPSASVHAYKLGRVPAKLPAQAKLLQEQLDDKLLLCARHSAAITGRSWADVVLGLRFDSQGQLLEARSAGQTRGDELVLDCLRYQLRELAGPGFDGREQPAKAAYELRRRYRVKANRGSGAPDDWRLPEVSAWIRNQQADKDTGVSGWAQFIEEDLAAGLTDEALDVAWTWHQARPNDILPYVSLGRALTAAGKPNDATRAYGSLIDIEPARPQTRRFAAALLESTGDPLALELAIDSYRKARALRPDHPTGYHALALALAQRGDYHEAVEVLVDALGRSYAAGHFGEVTELMRRDLETLAAVAILTKPDSRTQVLSLLVDTMVIPKAEARDRLLLTWESEASALALHVHDLDGARYHYAGGDAGFSAPVSNGYGPQGFEWPKPLSGPLRVEVLAPVLGPSGFAMGRIQRLRFDGEGAIEFDNRPFVIWAGEGAVDLGEIADRWSAEDDWRG